LPGILASLHEANPPSRRQRSARSEKAGGNRGAKARALGAVQCQQGKVACLHFGEAFGQQMTEALNYSTGEGAGVSAEGENPFIY